MEVNIAYVYNFIFSPTCFDNIPTRHLHEMKHADSNLIIHSPVTFHYFLPHFSYECYWYSKFINLVTYLPSHRLVVRLLSDVVVNFQSGQEEVTLGVSPERVIVRSYVENVEGSGGHVLTA